MLLTCPTLPVTRRILRDRLGGVEGWTAGALYEAALRRARSRPVEPPCRAGELARFVVVVDGRRIRGVSFRAQRCVSLLAFCEALARAVEGRGLDEAMAFDGPALRALVHGVPANKVDRSDRAVEAWRRSLSRYEAPASPGHVE